MLRLAIANIHRPGALTPSVVLSLGLGLALLVTVTQIDGNLRRQFLAALPDSAPSFYFIDIPDRRGRPLRRLPHKRRAAVDRRGRADAARPHRLGPRRQGRGHQAPPTDAAGCCRATAASPIPATIPHGSKVVEGEWWGADYAGPPLVSFEKKIADGLGLKLGDPIVVNVLGRNIKARIANLRTVDWESLGINFVLVFSPNAFGGAPHTHIATLTDTRTAARRAGDRRIMKAVGDAFPTVTTVRVKEAIETIGTVVTNLVLAIRGASALALIVGDAGARRRARRRPPPSGLRRGHPQDARRHARRGCSAPTRWNICCSALATAVFGVAAGSIAAWLVVTRVMTLSFVWQAGSAAGVVAGRAGRHGGVGARRHAAGTEPEAGHRAAEFMKFSYRLGRRGS